MLTQRSNLHVIVDLNLREHGNLFRCETKGNVTRSVTGAALDTPPVLDLGHDDVHTLAQEVVHVLSGQFAGDGQVLTLPHAETGNGSLGSVCLGAHVGDGLHDHASNVEVR